MMKRLSESEFKATFGEPMARLGPDTDPPFDFWSYKDALPEAEYEGHDFSAGQVAYVYQDPTARYQHVLVKCEDRNVFLVIVLDVRKLQVYGHRVLDLNEEYGISE